MANLSYEDVKLYMVDPRDEGPCLRELQVVFKEQMEHQQMAIDRVLKIEKVADRMMTLTIAKRKLTLMRIRALCLGRRCTSSSSIG